MKTENIKSSVGDRLLLAFVLLISLVFMACSQDRFEESQTAQDQNLLEESLSGPDQLNDQDPENQSLIPDNFQISINFDPTIFNLDEYELQEIFKIVILELYESTPGEGEYFGAHISINGQRVAVSPISGETSPSADGAYEKCGGQSGEGWKNYKVCHSEACVEEWGRRAAEDIQDKLKAGQSLDIRMKRNSLITRICGRVVGN